ncbi:hypothetical protein NQ315_007450 [Exocentrus adspersus]|uniref:THAP-type domain-containing protein n=1 Tax=Exocentrus adspersus TaxID=1586481 RepID=A0AAV8VHP1_9CUCU|nr:hypothetical protein NQ315_007450 [Exocentrus adspersus]
MPGIGSKCSVFSCKNRINRRIPGTSFHYFPKDLDLWEAWKLFCGHNADWQPSMTSRICSRHFTEEDFEIGCVIPSIVSDESERESVKQKQVLTYPKNIIEVRHDVAQKKQSFDAANTSTSACGSKENVEADSTNEFEPRTYSLDSTLILQNKKYLSVINALQEANKALATELVSERQKTAVLELIIKDLRKTLEESSSDSIPKPKLVKEIKTLFSGTLTSSQIDAVCNKGSKVTWTREDIVKAFTLRYLSKKAYVFVKEENYPLPGLGTLRRYAENINLRPGILYSVLNFMRIMATDMAEREKVAVLMFDKMKVTYTQEYDMKLDNVVGPYSYVQVVLARGLVGQWKQPVFVGFDRAVTEDILFEIISEMNKASFNVVAMVCECSPTNQGLLSRLGVNQTKNFFLNPDTKGFVLPNSATIKKDILEDLTRKTQDYETSFKLSEKHINCDRFDKQSAALATQLFSHYTATAVKRYYKTPDSETLAEFIQMISNWFDMFNSRHFISNSSQQPYDGNDDQVEKLSGVIDFFRHVRCIGKDDLQAFQKDIVLSCTSLQSLYADLKQRYDIKFLLTYKLSRDALEVLFSQIGTGGGSDDHPTPLNFLYRLKMIVSGKSPHATLQDKTNFILSNDEEEYVVSTVLHRSGLNPVIEEPSIDEPSEEFIEAGCLEYMSGWIARKFRNKYPDLAVYTSGNQTDFEHSYGKPSWVQQLSHGGLTEPSTKFCKNMKLLEWWFKKINKNSLAYKNKVVTKMYDRLRNKVDMPEEIIKAFVRQRIFIRLREINERRIKNKSKPKKKGERKKWYLKFL